jgi:hypothetical protein
MIEAARVPVIKAALTLPADVAALCGGAPLQLDISLEGHAHSGVASTILTRDVFCAHLPGLQPLVLVLKQLLSSRALNSAASGGLGSYALVLMAASLQQEAAAAHRGPSTSALLGVGHRLVRFLEYFSALPETPDALHAVVVDSAARAHTRQQPPRRAPSRPWCGRRRCEPCMLVCICVSHAARAPRTCAGLQPRRVRRGQLLEATAPTTAASNDERADGVAMGEADALYEAVYGSSLLVQDPLSPKFSNVSGAAFRWGLVQRCFREALARLHEALEAAGGGAHEALRVGDEWPLLAALLAVDGDAHDGCAGSDDAGSPRATRTE